MPGLFPSLRRPAASPSDEKDPDDDDDDDDDIETGTASSSSSSAAALSPLLLDQSYALHESSSSPPSFSLRVKLNDGKSTRDHVLPGVSPSSTTVGRLKARILALSPPDDADDDNNNGAGGERYLRLIVRGRMMAPDRASLDSFGISVGGSDVVHAVLGRFSGRGQQARMLSRMNGAVVGRGGGRTAGAVAGRRGDGVPPPSPRSPWRRTGIDWNGVVVPPRDLNDDTDDDDDDEEGEEEDGGGEGGSGRGVVDPETGGGGGRRGGRERRGFDRLRATGMSRDEVAAIRSYFARSVDRYIERRRAMIRASMLLRDTFEGMATTTSSSSSSSGGGPLVLVEGSTLSLPSSSPSRQHRGRSDTGESTNSLLLSDATEDGGGASAEDEDDDDDDGGGGDAANGGRGRGDDNNGRGGSGMGNGGTIAGDRGGTSNDGATTTGLEGEGILTDRPRMEDEWMSTQGPYSEFRMNLNTNNPLLLAAITGGGAGNPTGGGGGGPLGRTPGGLFFRSRNIGLGGDDDDDAGGEDIFGGAFGRGGAMGGGGFPGGGGVYHHPYLGPLPPAGTDKDFVWGFILGFFVGFIMLFWVWMPTVPHKQKIGIIAGISFQVALNMLRKSGQGEVVL